jgi:hypothetical protein
VNLKKLSKNDIEKKNHLAEVIRQKQDAATKAVTDFNAGLPEINEKLALMKAPVINAVSELNDAIKAANLWMEGIHRDQETYFNSKSEKWQSGTVGSDYGEWNYTYNEPISEALAYLPDPIDNVDEDFGDFACYIEELTEAPDKGE